MILAPLLRQRYFDANGNPLAGGKLQSYVAGTTTPLATYTDEGGLTPNANPVILDANGEANIWVNPTLDYKFVLKDSADVVLWTVDNVASGALGVDSVNTVNIVNGAVTAAKIADGSITAEKLATGAGGILDVALFDPTSNGQTYTITDEDVLLCDASDPAYTSMNVQLPVIGPSILGKKVTIKLLGSLWTDIKAQPTILPGVGNTISGLSTVSIYTPGETLTIVAYGTDWKVLEHKTAGAWEVSGISIICIAGVNPTKATTKQADRIVITRQGRFARLRYEYVAASATGAANGTGNYTFEYPANINLDTSTSTGISNTLAGRYIGRGVVDASVDAAILFDLQPSTGGFLAYGSTGTVVGSASLGLNTASRRYIFDVFIPVVGWKDFL